MDFSECEAHDFEVDESAIPDIVEAIRSGEVRAVKLEAPGGQTIHFSAKIVGFYKQEIKRPDYTPVALGGKGDWRVSPPPETSYFAQYLIVAQAE